MNRSRILVVDDNRDLAESLAEFLELSGYEVDTAYSGESCIEAVGKNGYDAVLIDVILPGKNGVETFAEIRKIEPTPTVLLMTGYSAQHLKDLAVELGALEVLSKPMDLDALLLRLNKVLRPNTAWG